MGLGASFAVLVVAEMIGVKAGLGWYLQWAQGWAAYANMYAALIVMALMCSGADHAAVPHARSPAGLAEGDRANGSRNRWRKSRRTRPPAPRSTSRTSATPSTSTAPRCRCSSDVSISRRAGRVRRAARPHRLRQVDLAAAGRRPRAAARPERCARTRRASPGRIPSRVVVFQDPTLFPWRTVWDNVALGLEARGMLKSQRQPRR